MQTYAELDERSSGSHRRCSAQGLARRRPVAVLLGNRGEYWRSRPGIAKAGPRLVPLNPRMTAPEVDYVVGHSGARGLILDEALANIAAAVVDALRPSCYSIDGTTLGADYEAALDAARADDPRIVDRRETDPFCIAYTSGTTGKPKGVLISHRSRLLTFTYCSRSSGAWAPAAARSRSRRCTTAPASSSATRRSAWAAPCRCCAAGTPRRCSR